MLYMKIDQNVEHDQHIDNYDQSMISLINYKMTSHYIIMGSFLLNIMLICKRWNALEMSMLPYRNVRDKQHGD